MLSSPEFAQGWSCGKDIQGRGTHSQGAIQQKDKRPPQPHQNFPWCVEALSFGSSQREIAAQLREKVEFVSCRRHCFTDCTRMQTAVWFASHLRAGGKYPRSLGSRFWSHQSPAPGVLNAIPKAEVSAYSRVLVQSNFFFTFAMHSASRANTGTVAQRNSADALEATLRKPTVKPDMLTTMSHGYSPRFPNMANMRTCERVSEVFWEKFKGKLQKSLRFLYHL